MELRILSDELEEIQVPWWLLGRIALIAFVVSYCVGLNVVEFGLSDLENIPCRS